MDGLRVFRLQGGGNTETSKSCSRSGELFREDADARSCFRQ